MVETENTVNLRPMTTISEDEVDRVICPNDFLRPKTGDVLMKVEYEPGDDQTYHPPGKLQSVTNLTKLHRATLTRLKEVWKMFIEGYLVSLRERWQVKNKKSYFKPRIGQVVIVHKYESPRNLWDLARVVGISSDRTVLIRRSDGNEYQRAFRHVYPLEIESQPVEDQAEEYITEDEEPVVPAKPPEKKHVWHGRLRPRPKRTKPPEEEDDNETIKWSSSDEEEAKQARAPKKQNRLCKCALTVLFILLNFGAIKDVSSSGPQAPAPASEWPLYGAVLLIMMFIILLKIGDDDDQTQPNEELHMQDDEIADQPVFGLVDDIDILDADTLDNWGRPSELSPHTMYVLYTSELGYTDSDYRQGFCLEMIARYCSKSKPERRYSQSDAMNLDFFTAEELEKREKEVRIRRRERSRTLSGAINRNHITSLLILTLCFLLSTPTANGQPINITNNGTLVCEPQAPSTYGITSVIVILFFVLMIGQYLYLKTLRTSNDPDEPMELMDIPLPELDELIEPDESEYINLGMDMEHDPAIQPDSAFLLPRTDEIFNLHTRPSELSPAALFLTYVINHGERVTERAAFCLKMIAWNCHKPRRRNSEPDLTRLKYLPLEEIQRRMTNRRRNSAIPIDFTTKLAILLILLIGLTTTLMFNTTEATNRNWQKNKQKWNLTDEQKMLMMRIYMGIPNTTQQPSTTSSPTIVYLPESTRATPTTTKMPLATTTRPTTTTTRSPPITAPPLKTTVAPTKTTQPTRPVTTQTTLKQLQKETDKLAGKPTGTFLRAIKRGDQSFARNHPNERGMIAPVEVTNAQKTYSFCRTKGSSLWRIPKTEHVCEVANKHREWKKGETAIYSKIAHPEAAENAFFCVLKHEEVYYYTNLLGDHHTDPPPSVIKAPLPVNECHDLNKLHFCNEGRTHDKNDASTKRMTKKNEKMYSTDNSLSVFYPGAFKGFFVGMKYSNATNCLIENVHVYYYDTTMKLFSPIYNLEHCLYPTGTCVVNNMTLIWTPKCRANCRTCSYKAGEEVEGLYSNDTFWITKKQLALTFPCKPQTMIGCDGERIVLSDQNIGISQRFFATMQRYGSRKRTRREAATTEELAAELTSEELSTMKTVRQSIEAVCDILAHVERDATKIAKRMLKNPHVMAKWRTEEILEVYQCTPVNGSQIRPRKTEQCYLYLPVEVYWDHFGWINAFLDTTTGIISKTAPEADCAIHQKHYIDLSNGIIRHDSITNDTQTIQEIELHHQPTEEVTNIDFTMEAFHDIVLTNDTQVFEQIMNGEHVDELERTAQWTKEADIVVTKTSEALSATPHSVPGLVKSYLFGWLGILHSVWLNVCAVFTTLQILLVVGYCCLPAFLVAPFRLVRRLFRRKRKTETPLVPAIKDKPKATTPPKPKLRTGIPKVRFSKKDDKVEIQLASDKEEGNNEIDDDNNNKPTTSGGQASNFLRQPSIMRRWAF
jgi:hypothetical protein